MDSVLQKISLAFGVLFVGLALFFGGRFVYANFFEDTQTVSLASGQKIKLEIAESQQERTAGLSGRSSLDGSDGMLFIFDQPSQDNCFWMKDTLLDLDIIFLDDSKKIIDIFDSVKSSSYQNKQNFCPSSPSKYTIEIAAGRAQDLDIQIGQNLSW